MFTTTTKWDSTEKGSGCVGGELQNVASMSGLQKVITSNYPKQWEKGSKDKMGKK